MPHLLPMFIRQFEARVSLMDHKSIQEHPALETKQIFDIYIENTQRDSDTYSQGHYNHTNLSDDAQ